MPVQRSFSLNVGQEKVLVFPMRFTDELASGRTKLPYTVETTDDKGKTVTRRGFIAVHCLKPIPKGQVPRLLLHHTLDNGGPAKVATGNGKPIVSRGKFVTDGRFGKALSGTSGGFAIEVDKNIRAEQGALSIWLRYNKKRYAFYDLIVHGGGGLFIGTRGNGLFFNGTGYQFPPELSDQKKIGRWRHFAITWTPSSWRAYLDGKPLPIAKGGRGKFGKPQERHERIRLAVPSRRIELCGARNGGAPDADDLRVYSVPLTPREIEALYQREDPKNEH